MTKQEAVDIISEEFGQDILPFLQTNLFATACPEQACPPDPFYGWNPLLREMQLPGGPYFVLKEQCFGCGYHKAMWIGMEWNVEARRKVGQLWRTLQIMKEEV